MKRTDLLHGVAGVIAGRWYVKRLEAELRDCFGVRHVFLVSSGKAALTTILRALGRLSDKTEVVVPAYTCFSVPAAIVRAGLTVRLADINPDDLDYDHDDLDGAITDNTLAVLAHHLFGIPCDMGRLRRVCQEKGLFLVEDAAQAMGGRLAGRMLGTLGDVGFFSLGRGKNITCGSGGIIVTDCDRIGEAVAAEYRRLPVPGIVTVLRELISVVAMTMFVRPNLYWLPAGMKFLKLGETLFDERFPIRRLSGTSAGILRNWRQRLAESNDARRSAGAYFGARLQWTHVPGPSEIPYLRMPLLVETREIRDRIFARGAERGLGVSRMYPHPVAEITQLRASFNGKRFPSAKSVADRLVTLPTHHFVKPSDRDAIRAVLEAAGGPGHGRP